MCRLYYRVPGRVPITGRQACLPSVQYTEQNERCMIAVGNFSFFLLYDQNPPTPEIGQGQHCYIFTRLVLAMINYGAASTSS
jgi:hypothetical protein